MNETSSSGSGLRIRAVFIFNGIFALSALAWGYLRGDLDVFHHPAGILFGQSPSLTRIIVGVITGWILGVLVAKLSRFTVYRYEWAKTLHWEFKKILGPLSNKEIFIYALSAAVAEEMFFRGAMQAELGLVISSLIFGAVHVAVSRKLWLWPLEAAAMGFIFGLLFWLLGDLTAPIVLHFTINYRNLHFINNYNPQTQLPRALESP